MVWPDGYIIDMFETMDYIRSGIEDHNIVTCNTVDPEKNNVYRSPESLCSMLSHYNRLIIKGINYPNTPFLSTMML